MHQKRKTNLDHYCELKVFFFSLSSEHLYDKLLPADSKNMAYSLLNLRSVFSNNLSLSAMSYSCERIQEHFYLVYLPTLEKFVLWAALGLIHPTAHLVKWTKKHLKLAHTLQFHSLSRLSLTSAEGSGGLENARLSFVASCDVTWNVWPKKNIQQEQKKRK